MRELLNLKKKNLYIFICMCVINTNMFIRVIKDVYYFSSTYNLGVYDNDDRKYYVFIYVLLVFL